MRILIKTLIITAILGIIITGILYVNNRMNANSLEKMGCSTFKSWQYVNRIFQEDPHKYRSLDADDDGIPCEAIMNK